MFIWLEESWLHTFHIFFCYRGWFLKISGSLMHFNHKIRSFGFFIFMAWQMWLQILQLCLVLKFSAWFSQKFDKFGSLDNGAEKLQVVQRLFFCSNVSIKCFKRVVIALDDESTDATNHKWLALYTQIISEDIKPSSHFLTNIEAATGKGIADAVLAEFGERHSTQKSH